tara:strand:- start:713 stop:1462 length:750 start_codon:yes stop_codon:yes gene_type:complete
MTIDEIYRLVQTFANKEQRGFITPSDFNLLAKQAELELVNKRLDVLQEKSQPKKAGGFVNESLTPEMAEQDLAPFLFTTKYGVVARTVTSGYLETEVAIPVTDNILLIKEVFILPDEKFGINSHTPLELVKPENINKVLRSSLVKPSMDFPIGLMSGSTTIGNLRIRVFPESIKNVMVHCYKMPSESPEWNYVTIAGKPVHDPSNSTQFRFPSRVHGEIVVKILEYLGVNLREAQLVQYAQGNEVKADS